MVADAAPLGNRWCHGGRGSILVAPGATLGEEGAVNKNSTSRREFLRASGGALGVAWLGLHWPEFAAAAQHAHEAAAGRIDHELKVLTAHQARDVAAIAAQIVPGGNTPGATEAGVVYFIDHIHAGLYARSAPEFLAGLAAFQSEFARQHPGAGQFADLDASAQHAYLKSIATTPFFGSMRYLAIVGLLALPSYGGNENKLGWKLVGFVDQHAWTAPYGYYDRDYPGFVPYEQGSRS
jgi:gluconate 2-dehydrogenase gamma chain